MYVPLLSKIHTPIAYKDVAKPHISANKMRTVNSW